MNSQPFKQYIHHCRVADCPNIFKDNRKGTERCPEHTIPLSLRTQSQIGKQKIRHTDAILKLREQILFKAKT